MEHHLVCTPNFPYCTINFSLRLEAILIKVYTLRIVVSSSFGNR